MVNVCWLNSVVAIAPILATMLPISSAIAASTVPDPAKHLPRQTAYAILLDMREETWQQLNQYALFQRLQAQTEVPPNPGGLPFLPADLDYQTEIAPWVGDTTALALMPLDRPRATALKEHEVLIAPIADAAEFEGFIDTVADLRGREPEMQPYQTLDILYWEPQFLEADDAAEPMPAPASPDAEPTEALPKSTEWRPTILKVLPENAPETSLPPTPEPVVPGLAIAVLPEFVVAAEHPAAIRAWLDRRPESEAESLAGHERFLRTLAHPHYDEALGTFYGSLSELVKYSQSDFAVPDLPFDVPLPDDITPRDIALLASLQLDSSIEVLIYPTASGIRIQGRGYYDNTILQAVPATTEPAPTEVLTHLPGDSFAMLSGHNLATFWQETAAALEANEDTRAVLQQARGFFSAFTGLDLDQDLFAWMDQGFSVFLFPTEQTPLTLLSSDLQIGLGIVLQTSDRAKAEATFAALDERLGAGLIAVETSQLNDKPLTSWGYLFDGEAAPESFVGRGWASEDTLLLTTSLGSLSEIFRLEPHQKLSNAFRFTRSTRDFPAENQGYLYGNLGPVQRLLARFFPPDPDHADLQEWREILTTIQAFSSTFSFGEAYLQLDGLVMLAPAEP